MIVDNRGEDAFEAQLFLTLPQGVVYVKVVESDRVSISEIGHFLCQCLPERLNDYHVQKVTRPSIKSTGVILKT